MSRVRILTDTTAQFSQPGFPGQELVSVIPSSLVPSDGHPLPLLARGRTGARLVPPAVPDFLQAYTRMALDCDGILVLTLSSQLGPLAERAAEAARLHSNHAEVEVVDSQTAGVGLGLLVETAARLALQGGRLRDLVHQVRGIIPHIYMLFCIPELTYLAQAGYIAYSQALVGEMLGMLPVFTLEDGRLTPLEKVRTPRHLFESFQEFISEFDQPEHIALMRGADQNSIRSRPLRQYAQDTFPGTPFSEHTLHPHLAALLGPQSIALVIKEKLDERML